MLASNIDHSIILHLSPSLIVVLVELMCFGTIDVVLYNIIITFNIV